MKKAYLVGDLAAAILVIGLLALFASGDDERSFDPVSQLPAALEADAQSAQQSAGLPTPALPDPSLGEQKVWKAPGSEGPPPEGYGSHFVQHERALHVLFRRHLGDAIELCLDEMRRRGKSFDGRLIFHVTALPVRDLKVSFRLNGIRTEGDDGNPAAVELPHDVHQCIWDTVEAVEVKLPLIAVSIFPREGQPDLFVPYEVREESPLGPVEVELEDEVEAFPDAGSVQAPPPAAIDAGRTVLDAGAKDLAR